MRKSEPQWCYEGLLWKEGGSHLPLGIPEVMSRTNIEEDEDRDVKRGSDYGKIHQPAPPIGRISKFRI